MADVKWIKITTSMFDDEKIDFIESLPEADTLLVVWVKLLAQAGKCNAGGFIFLTESIPYTDESLAHKFRRPLNTIKLALATFINLGMIQKDESGFLKVANWEKHQNIEGLEKIKEQTRQRVAKHREKQKLPAECNVTCNATVTQGNATDIELERELEEDKNNIYALSKDNISTILSEWNKLGLQTVKAINPNTNRHKLLKARVREYNLDGFLEAIHNIKKSKFLQGQNGKGWTVTFDWLIKPNNFLKVLEGNYSDKVGDNNERPGQDSSEHQNAYSSLVRYD